VHGEALPDFFSTSCDLCVLILCCVASDALAPSRHAVCVAISKDLEPSSSTFGWLFGWKVSCTGRGAWKLILELLMKVSLGLMADLGSRTLEMVLRCPSVWPAGRFLS
jgi:hypothetical protein